MKAQYGRLLVPAILMLGVLGWAGCAGSSYSTTPPGGDTVFMDLKGEAEFYGSPTWTGAGRRPPREMVPPPAF